MVVKIGTLEFRPPNSLYEWISAAAAAVAILGTVFSLHFSFEAKKTAEDERDFELVKAFTQLSLKGFASYENTITYLNHEIRRSKLIENEVQRTEKYLRLEEEKKEWIDRWEKYKKEIEDIESRIDHMSYESLKINVLNMTIKCSNISQESVTLIRNAEFFVDHYILKPSQIRKADEVSSPKEE